MSNTKRKTRLWCIVQTEIRYYKLYELSWYKRLWLHFTLERKRVSPWLTTRKQAKDYDFPKDKKYRPISYTEWIEWKPR